MRSPVLRPAAAADIEDAYQWYERRRNGLGDEFLASVSSCLESIAWQPEQYPEVYRHTRRALLQRFPYGIFYRISSDDVLVIACFHARRNPKLWRSR